jgi:PPOX class probable F420-dependent enzyme
MVARAPATGARQHAYPAARAETQVPRIVGKYLSITSYRRDGTGVMTPVWFVTEDDQLLVITAVGSGKVKRIRRNPFVTMAACSARGRLRGEPIAARAELLPSTEVERVKRLMGRKYRFDLLFIGPIRALQSLLHPERRNETTTVVAITPTSS